MGIRFSAKAIKASFLVENCDWYRYKITDVLEKEAASGTSKNYIYIFEGVDSPGTSNEMSGVQVSKLINEKADWVAYPIYRAANGGKDLDPETDAFDTHEKIKAALVGITMEAYTKRGARQDGTPQNELVDFRPLS